MLAIGLVTGLALVGIYVLVRSGVRVEAGSVAVLSSFGRLVRAPDGDARVLHAPRTLRTLPPGVHSKRPWARAVVVSLAERSLAAAAEDAPFEVLAGDGTRIRIGARLRYRVERAHLATYLVASVDPLAHLAGWFRLVLREQIARFEIGEGELSSYTALRLRMPELQQRIRAELAPAALAELGIRVVAVDLVQIDPPEELVDALNAVVGAESEAASLVARAELASQQRSLAAAHAVEIAAAHAAGQESEILTIGAELAVLHHQGVLEGYVDRRRAEILGGSQRVYFHHSKRS